MIDRRELLIRSNVEMNTLEVWIKEEWLRPRTDDRGEFFSDADVARARLIQDLQKDLGLNDEAIPVVLDLIDQIHGLRRTLRDVISEMRKEFQE